MDNGHRNVVDFPNKNGGSFHCYVSSPEGISSINNHTAIFDPRLELRLKKKSGWGRVLCGRMKLAKSGKHLNNLARKVTKYANPWFFPMQFLYFHEVFNNRSVYFLEGNINLKRDVSCKWGHLQVRALWLGKNLLVHYSILSHKCLLGCRTPVAVTRLLSVPARYVATQNPQSSPKNICRARGRGSWVKETIFENQTSILVSIPQCHNATYGWTKIEIWLWFSTTSIIEIWVKIWSTSKTREAIYAYIYIILYTIVLVILIQKFIRDGSVGPTFHRPPAVATAGRCLSPLVGTGKQSWNSRVIKIWPTDTPKSSYIWWNGFVWK